MRACCERVGGVFAGTRVKSLQVLLLLLLLLRWLGYSELCVVCVVDRECKTG